MDQKTTIDKLRVLLPHWVEHNHHHGEDFRKWASLAKEEGHAELATLLDQAVASMAATDAILEKALAAIGGPAEEHHHHHHGHHHHHHD
ncbi:MAG: hypothetical protein ACOY3Z_06745 [Thermodesulfobacteriota bacterium]